MNNSSSPSASNGNKVAFTGKSGKAYAYDAHSITEGIPDFPSKGGNYVFIKTNYGDNKPVYIGITNDLSTRFYNHHKMPEITKAGANAIGIRINESEDERRREEKDLLEAYKTPCNEINN